MLSWMKRRGEGASSLLGATAPSAAGGAGGEGVAFAEPAEIPAEDLVAESSIAQLVVDLLDSFDAHFTAETTPTEARDGYAANTIKAIRETLQGVVAEFVYDPARTLPVAIDLEALLYHPEREDAVIIGRLATILDVFFLSLNQMHKIRNGTSASAEGAPFDAKYFNAIANALLAMSKDVTKYVLETTGGASVKTMPFFKGGAGKDTLVAKHKELFPNMARALDAVASAAAKAR